MKPIKKTTAKVFIALIAIFAVIGTFFTFVPINAKSFSFSSMIGLINYSSDLGAGVFAEYDIDGDFSEAQISRSVSTIKSVLAEQGYPGANIFAIGKEKIRVEIGYKKSETALADSNTILSAVAVGKFELRSSSSEEDTFIVGKDHIKDVGIKTYNDSIYVTLDFNKAGEAAYAELLEATQTIYVCMGGETMTSFSSENASASSQLPLSFPDLDQAEDFAMRVKLGCLETELNKDTITIDTMSSTLANGALNADPSSKSFGYSAAKVTAFVAIAVVIVLGIAYLVLRHGVVGAFTALALLFDSIIATILLGAFTWVEISLSSLYGVALGFAVLLASANIYASRIEEEFNQGKTVGASLESGFKRSLAPVVATGIVLTVIFGVVAIVASAEMKVFGLITCIFSCLSLFSTIIMIPGFIRIFEAFNDGAIKAYRLKVKEEATNND